MRANPKTLAIVGAGRVGRALGKLLRERGWQIGPVVARSQRTARAAVKVIGAGNPQSQLNGTIVDAHLVLITTPDRQIAKVARELAKIAGRQRKLDGKIILHTNGALDRSVLVPLEKLGAATGSLHPLQTFSKGARPNLKGSICAVEGTPKALSLARRISRELGCIPVLVAPGAKSAYHAAGALAAGHILGVMEAATQIMTKAGFSRREAVGALLPLTRQTLANFEKLGPGASWTGPLARGDFATVRKHQAALGRFPREYAQAYKALSQLAIRVLQKGSRR
jgi:predicted short-subunit dehydrogenase-like oxidoreductase (DUF2520 family)